MPNIKTYFGLGPDPEKELHVEWVRETDLKPRQGPGGRSNQKVENKAHSMLRQLAGHEPR